MGFRILVRYKGYFFVNLAGLSLGVAATCIIFLFVMSELHWDSHHEKSNRIHLVTWKFVGEDYIYDRSAYILGPTLVEHFPEIEKATRLRRIKGEIEHNSIYENVNDFMIAEPSLFELFDIPLVNGSEEGALSNPDSIVISETLARKHFGDSDPIGKDLHLYLGGKKITVIVTGVLKDMKRNSYLKTDCIVPLEKWMQLTAHNKRTDWDHCWYQTFILLAGGMDKRSVENRLASFSQEYITSRRERRFTFERLSEIHLTTNIKQRITIYSMISILILLTAVFNYVILNTALSAPRFKEIGMRKVLGASRRDILKQAYAESTVMGMLTVPLAHGIVEIALPYFNNFTHQNLGIIIYSNGSFFWGLVALIALVILGSGAYIGFYLAQFQPTEVFKQSVSTGQKKPILRKTLVAFQLGFFMALMFGTVILKQQIHFLRTKDMGFEKENVVIIPIPRETQEMALYRVYKEKIQPFSQVLCVSGSSRNPLSKGMSASAIPKVNEPETTIIVETLSVDYDYIETLGFKLLAGRSFSKQHNDLHKVEKNGEKFTNIIVNKKATEVLGIHSPVGYAHEWFRIIGVIDNFHLYSLKSEIEPLLLMMTDTYIDEIVVKINSTDIKETLAILQDQWKEVYQNYPFTYHFFDDRVNRLYQSEINFEKIIDFFTFLTILITTMGLFCLSLLIMQQRTKEMAIRKVMGAKGIQIIAILCKEFLVLIGIAGVFSLTFAYYFVSGWLSNFSFHIKIGFMPFLITGSTAIFIVLSTVGMQAFRIVRTNPIEILRSE